MNFGRIRKHVLAFHSVFDYISYLRLSNHMVPFIQFWINLWHIIAQILIQIANLIIITRSVFQRSINCSPFAGSGSYNLLLLLNLLVIHEAIIQNAVIALNLKNFRRTATIIIILFLLCCLSNLYLLTMGIVQLRLINFRLDNYILCRQI